MVSEFLIKTILSEELFDGRVCESIADHQIVNYIYNRLLLEKLLVGEPMSIEELRKLLRKKIVNFEFIKLDGEVRPAKGTTMLKYVPPKDHPKGIRPSSPKVATFYDLDKDAWRSVSRRSKEIVLKKDEISDKPIIVVKDKTKVKVKPVTKERESKDPIEQGNTYKYTTNRGTNTYIEVLRELPNGLFQVSSPVFKTTFAIDGSRIGNKFEPEPEKIKVKDVDIRKKEQEPTEPQEEQPLKTNVIVTKEEKPEDKEKPKQQPTTQKQNGTQIIIPKEVKSTETREETKAPPKDITPELPEEEGPEELTK